jgi:hypothetical protein
MNDPVWQNQWKALKREVQQRFLVTLGRVQVVEQDWEG